METNTLRCQKLEIVDENGKCRMVLYAEDSHSSIIFLTEESPYMQIRVSKKGDANICMLDKEGAVRCSFGLVELGNVGFSFNDVEGKPRLMGGIRDDSNKATIICNGQQIA
jgi:hypothetical protein